MAPETKAAEVAAPVHDKAQYLALLRHNTQLLQRSVAHVEQRYTARVVRSLPYMRCLLYTSDAADDAPRV